jgi:L-lactate dehydrogenase complex protein LldG
MNNRNSTTDKKYTNSRSRILEAVAKSKPAATPLPDLRFALSDNETQPELVSSFEQFVQGVGGRVFQLEGAGAIRDYLQKEAPTDGLVINRVEEIGPIDEVPESLSTLDTLQRAYIRGKIGVAENGAIWVDETAMGKRIISFICQELVLVINAEDIVPTMHQAYNAIQVNGAGFGVFIAGPSKTADIEQSLVIGAHGPVALTVLILK